MGTLHSDDLRAPDPGRPSEARRRVVLSGAVLGIGLLTAVHVHVLRTGTGVTGPLLVLDHLFTIALAGGLLLLCAALGGSAIRLLRIEHDSAVEMLAFSLAAGCGLLGTVILLVGALGGFRPPLLGLLIVVTAAISRREIAHLPHRLRGAAIELRAKAGKPALIVLGVVGYAMTLQALAPPSDWDSLMYHLRLPAQFLERGGLFVPEDNLHVAQTALLHMLYVPLLAAGAPAACAVINVIFALGLAVMLLNAGHRLVSPATGQLAAALLWASPVVILIGVTPRIDVALAFFLFVGHWALLCALWNGAQAAKWLALAGALLGFAAALKYPGLAYLPAVAPVVLLASMSSASGTSRRAWLCGVFGVCCAAAVMPWLVKNWSLLGAPLYPFFADRVLPPWLAALHGSVNLPDGISAESLRPLGAVRAPFDLMSWFTAPESLVPEREGVWYRANVLFVLIPLAAPLLRNRAFAMLVLPSLLYLAIVVAVQSQTNVRYLTPAIPGLTLAAAAVTARGLSRIRNARARTVIAVLVGVVCLSAPAAALTEKLVRTRAPAHAFGLISADDYWRNSLDPEIRWYGRMTARVDELVPSPEARVLLLFEARGYGYRTEVIQDNVLTNWTFLAPLVRSPRCLESPPFTHVLVASGALDYYVGRGLDPHSIGWDAFDDFAARCLTPAGDATGLKLYKVRSWDDGVDGSRRAPSPPG